MFPVTSLENSFFTFIFIPDFQIVGWAGMPNRQTQATLLKNPSKYATMVLDEINKHFKISEKEYKQMRLSNAVMEVLNMKYDDIQNQKEDQDEILWVEGNGIGYCLTEEDYNDREKEVKQHKKKKLENKIK